MITKEIALNSGYGTVFYHRSFRNRDGSAKRCRVTGKCKVWKTRPKEFRLPVKVGWKESNAIDHWTCDQWFRLDITQIDTLCWMFHLERHTPVLILADKMQNEGYEAEAVYLRNLEMSK